MVQSTRSMDSCFKIVFCWSENFLLPLQLWSDLGPSKQASLCQVLEEDTDLCNLVWQVLNTKRNDSMELDLRGDAVTQFMDLMNSVGHSCFAQLCLVVLTIIFCSINQKSFGHSNIVCQTAFRLLVGLLQACDIAPSSLFISDVRLLEDDAVFHGVYADIFKGFKDGQEVALKRPRIYIGHDQRRTQQVLSFLLFRKRWYQPYTFLGTEAGGAHKTRP
jgi:hypothetical protein